MAPLTLACCHGAKSDTRRLRIYSRGQNSCPDFRRFVSSQCVGKKIVAPFSWEYTSISPCLDLNGVSELVAVTMSEGSILRRLGDYLEHPVSYCPRLPAFYDF